jgi:hypothetical protein
MEADFASFLFLQPGLVATTPLKLCLQLHQEHLQVAQTQEPSGAGCNKLSQVSRCSCCWQAIVDPWVLHP